MTIGSGLDDLASSGGIVAVVGGSLAWAVRTLFRRAAKDLTEVRNDLSQADYIKTLRDDVDNLRKDLEVIASERNRAVSEIGSLLARVEMLTNQLCNMRSGLREYKKIIDNHERVMEDHNCKVMDRIKHGSTICSGCTIRLSPFRHIEVDCERSEGE